MKHKKVLTALFMAALLIMLFASLTSAQGPQPYYPGYNSGPCPGCNQYGYGYSGPGNPYSQSPYASGWAEGYRWGYNDRTWGNGYGQNHRWDQYNGRIYSGYNNFRPSNMYGYQFGYNRGYNPSQQGWGSWNYYGR